MAVRSLESVEGAVHESARRRKILVIDDEPTLTKVMRRMLAAHQVTTVNSVPEALELIVAGERYDVIISDLLMPGMSGMDLHERMQELAPDQVAKIVFMTGGAVTERARAFFDQVPNPMLEKPFDKQALLSLIDGLVQ